MITLICTKVNLFSKKQKKGIDKNMCLLYSRFRKTEMVS